MRTPSTLIFLALAATTAAARAPAADQSPDSYRFVTVEDFVVNGPQLAAEHVSVRLVGSYILQGNVPVLFANMQQLLMTLRSPETGTYPSVPLLTNDASPAVRRALISCDSDPAARQLGCQVGIQGVAVMCSLTNVFGAARDNVPCVDVRDGGRWTSPPATPAQLQQAKVAEDAREAREVAEAVRASKKFFFHGQRVEYCMEQPSSAGYGHGDLNLINTACGGEDEERCVKQVSVEMSVSGDPDPVATAGAECATAHAQGTQAVHK